MDVYWFVKLTDVCAIISIYSTRALANDQGRSPNDSHSSGYVVEVFFFFFVTMVGNVIMKFDGLSINVFLWKKETYW